MLPQGNIKLSALRMPFSCILRATEAIQTHKNYLSLLNTQYQWKHNSEILKNDIPTRTHLQTKTRFIRLIERKQTEQIIRQINETKPDEILYLNDACGQCNHTRDLLYNLSYYN